MTHITKKCTMIIVLTLLIATILVTLPSAVSAQSSTDWPMYGYDAANTNFGTSPIPDNLKIDWRFQTGGPVVSTPAVVGNKLYIGAETGYLYCLDADTGEEIWGYKTGKAITSSPAVYDGKVYFGSLDHFIYCLDASDGGLEWKYETNYIVHSCPTIYEDKVYIGSNDKFIYCLDAQTGDLVWKFETRGQTSEAQGVEGQNTYAFYHNAPAVVDDVCYVGSFDHYVYALDANTGVMIWETMLPDSNMNSSPTVADGRLLIGNDIMYHFCLNITDGSILWDTKLTVEGAFWSESTGGYAYGNLYGASYHFVYAWEPETGELIFKAPVGTMQKASTSISDGKILTANHDRHFYMFDAHNGEKIQSMSFVNGFDSTPIPANGKVYIANYDGNVYCLVDGEGEQQYIVSFNVNINVQPKTIPLGSNMEIEGWIMSFAGQWPVGAFVEITYTKPGGSTVTNTAQTGSAGEFFDSIPADMLGTWKVVTTYSENLDLGTLTSFPQTFTVVAADPTPTPTPTQTPEPSEEPTGLNTTEQTIIGAVVVTAIIIAAVSIYMFRKKQK